MADNPVISVDQLLAVRQHAVNVALEVAKLNHDSTGLVPNASSIEQFVLTGVVPSSAPVQQGEPVAEAAE